MKERRVSERHKLMMYLQVHDQETKELVGHVVDLSSGGLMLVADTPFEPKSRHELKVALPFQDQETEGRTMDISVECCWCGPDVNDEYYDAGFRFLTPTTHLDEMISDVVEDVGFISL